MLVSVAVLALHVHDPDVNEAARDVGGRPYEECASCGKVSPSGRPLCDSCAARHKDSIAHGVLFLGSIGYLLLMTAWLGQRVWQWPRIVSAMVAALGVLVLADAVRAFRFRRRVYSDRRQRRS